MAIVVPQYKKAPEGGEYRIALASGAVTVVAADAPVFSMRWTNTTLACVVKQVNLLWTMSTAFGTAQDVAFGLYFARSYSVVDSGGTAATLTGNNAKMKTSFPTSRVADMRIATTGALTAGTRTLDTQPLAVKSGGTNTLGLGGNNALPWEFGILDATQPIILVANEGLVLNNLVLMGATGVMTIRVVVEWSEVDKGKV